MQNALSGKWKHTIEEIIFPQLDAFSNRVNESLYPALNNMQEEEEKIRKKVEEKYSYADPSDVCDQMEDEVVIHLIYLIQIKYSTLNLLAVGLYHTLEQHLAWLCRDENRFYKIGVLDDNLSHLYESKDFLEKYFSLELEKFNSWQKIDELRLVANTVKHAEGSKTDDLRKLRADLFIPPNMRSYPDLTNDISLPKVEYTATGEHFFISIDDLNQYFKDVKSFWQELIEKSCQ